MALMRLLLFALFWIPEIFPETITDRYWSNFIISQGEDSSDCFRWDNSKQIPQRCVSEFVNAAFNKQVIVSNTCGKRQPTHYCSQISLYGSTKVCSVCDDRVRDYSHPPEYLTDFNDPKNETWWQSETMNEGIQYPNNVTLTLWLGKAFDITYVRLKFISPRPESFAIYKKTTMDGDWIPWQFYSGSCKSTYKLPERAPILPGNEDVAQCSREFSDISPLSGGNIAFSTLDGRPSSENFEESEILQEWVTAVAIRVVFNRLNTFGDEVFKDPKVLKSYYYAVSDLTVGGRCKCNGHAKSCVMSSGIDVERQLVCQCQHNTAGSECHECDSFHQDRPWRRANSEDANECMPCNCNGLSSRCFFDSELYNRTGHGGHCLDCSGNTRGPHCEHCLDGFYRRAGEHFCIECDCDMMGSFSVQCDTKGQCQCKPGVTGSRCDQCKPGFYDFSSTGCKDCSCEAAGSWNNQPHCSSSNGNCQCKANIEGQKCDNCKPGYFNLSPNNQFGCTPCFCYGHSSVCSSTDGYYSINITSTFDLGDDQWTAASERKREEVQWDESEQAIAVSQLDYYPVYFYAPDEYLGDLRFAYNQFFTFILRVQLESTAPSGKDVIIVGANGRELTVPITGQDNYLPDRVEQIYRFRLHESYWAPRLPETDFIGIITNVTAIKIRGTYSRGDVGFLSEFSLSTASRSQVSLTRADWVEHCSCPMGHVGQFCESCAPGYRRAIKFGGPLTKCIKCDCHGHSDSCDAESGACICQHNTAGDTCESCARGYYGNALNGTEVDCTKCDCPDDGPCLSLPEGGMACSECPIGHAGKKCEYCASEFYGNPSEDRPCKPCPCNDNIDFNAIGNCDTNTGECRKCIMNTTGFNCERCKSGFWGNATADLKNDCRECSCYPPGTRKRFGNMDEINCHSLSGQCNCMPHVSGRNCDACEKGYYNITSGNGCTLCECDAMGSEDNFCDVVTGKCKCKPGVTGLKCDQCAREFFGFSFDGCKPCACDPIGSEMQKCDFQSGQCLCRDNVEGRRCDQCSENRFNMRAGCLPCDDCYTLIQTRKNDIANKMEKIDDGLSYWESKPITVSDEKVTEMVNQQRKEIGELRNRMNEVLDPQSISKLKSFKSLIPRASKSLSKSARFNELFSTLDGGFDDIEDDLKDIQIVIHNYTNQFNAQIKEAQTKGSKLLQIAKENVKKYGTFDPHVSEMALDAQQIAQKHTKIRDEFKDKTNEIVKRTHQIRDEVHEAVYGEKTSKKVEELEKWTNETTILLVKAKTLVAETAFDSEKALNEALKIWTKVNETKLPHVEVEKIKNDIMLAQNETHFQKTAFKEMLEDQKKTREDIRVALKNARKEVKIMEVNNMGKQRVLNKILAQKNQTEAAMIELSDKVNEAKKILYSFENYGINDGKNKFNEILADVSLIQSDIRDANNKSAKAEELIGNSEEFANKALAIALEIQQQAEATAKHANELNEAVEALVASVEKTDQDIKSIGDVLAILNKASAELENRQDRRKHVEAENRKAALTELNANKTMERLDELDDTLVQMKLELHNVEPVPDSTLTELEELLANLQSKVKSNRITRAVKRQATRDLTVQRDAVRNEFLILEKELDSLKQIYDSLPDKCYNVVQLEQTGE